MTKSKPTAIFLKDLINNPSLLGQLRSNINLCCVCGCHTGFINGRHRTARGLMCDDDYYGALGELVEAHPIASAGIRRG